MYGEYHILSSLLLLWIIYAKAHLTHTPVVVEEVACPRDIGQAVLTAILPSGFLQQLFECHQSLPDITY